MAEPLTFDPFNPEHTHAIDRIAQRLHREAPVLRLPGGFVLVSRFHQWSLSG